MKIAFHGADRGVTGSCHRVECAGIALLVDCGLYQGGREIEEENPAFKSIQIYLSRFGLRTWESNPGNQE